MSHQQSQREVAQSALASAAQNVANTLDPTEKKDEDKDKKEPTFKDKLDQAAYAPAEKGEAHKNESFIEKAASYIPGVSSLLGKSTEEKETDTSAKEAQENPTPGPPINRPDHDIHVEEFVREQYKSKSGADMPNVGEKSRDTQGGP